MRNKKLPFCNFWVLAIWAKWFQLDCYFFLNIYFFKFRTALATEHFDFTPYPELLAWFEKVKGEIPNYEKANGEGCAKFGGFFKEKTKKE